MAYGNSKEKYNEREVYLDCLNTVAPEPLNWKMWCPKEHAKITEWTDANGGIHRLVKLKPQKTVTAAMANWFFSPLYPRFLEFRGKNWYWYHLWHPIDHIKSVFAPLPNPVAPFLPGLYVLINEHYRAGPGYTVDTWFHVENYFAERLHDRFIATINIAGHEAFTLIHRFIDTPEGMVMELEYILGFPPKGYDKNPLLGSGPLLGALNRPLVQPVADHLFGGDYKGLLDASCLHAVEEFGNLQFFLPEVWNRYHKK